MVMKRKLTESLAYLFKYPQINYMQIFRLKYICITKGDYRKWKYCLVFLPSHDSLRFRCFENIFLAIMIKKYYGTNSF